MSSNAVTLDRISRIVGYKLTKGNFQVNSPNLPQRIAILGEANDANQATLSTLPQQITSSQQASILYGDGSPIHMMARIIFPVQSDGVGGIPVFVYPQAKAVGATQKIWKILPTGVATSNVTHYLKIAGREGIDGTFYAINVVVGDITSTIIQKIQNVVNSVFGCPVTANIDTYEAVLTSNWSGLTANEITMSVDTNGNAAGLSYSVLSVINGSGTPSIAGALNQFGSDWNTIVLDGYGVEATTMAALMSFNGIPDPANPTGRYTGIIMKPFIAIVGSVAEITGLGTGGDVATITDSFQNDVTVAIAPAPGSLAMSFEAAANMALLYALTAQNTPHLDVGGQYYPDMPASLAWSQAAMSQYANRDIIIKKGCSTVNLVAGSYQVQDFVTTYHPLGENPPQYRYVRNINVDFNVRYTYYLLEQSYVVDHTIANDSDTVSVENVIKPKIWTAVLFGMADDLASRALIVDASFLQASIVVNIGTSDPDRFETFFRYKRSGIARISSTTAQAGFNFGTV